MFPRKLCRGSETGYNQVQTRDDVEFVVSDSSGSHQIIGCGWDEGTRLQHSFVYLVAIMDW